MLKGPTVLILGAGSSVDFGLPVGSTLADDIRREVDISIDDDLSILRGSEEIAESFLVDFEHAESELYFDDGRRLASALPNFSSIDDALFTHSHDDRIRLIGKAAIARIISKYERASFVNGLWSRESGIQDRALREIEASWAQTLIRILVTRVRYEDRLSVLEKLTIITFNYDRCIESILFHSLQKAFSMGTEDATEAMSRLKVFRPYGGLGVLPYSDGVERAVPFGTDVGWIQLAANISVYTDDLGERPDLVEMRAKLEEAASAVFLGFAFHPQNVQTLSVRPANAVATFGTATRESDPRRQGFIRSARSIFDNKTDPRIILPNFDCKALLEQYGAELGD